MRVIAGKARRLPLKTIPGVDTRPTTDRIKETLFNMLQPDLQDTFFLDLFSGSGAIGIEALSRGAEFAWFVEQNKAACQCIEENLTFTKLLPQSEIMQMDCMHAIVKLEQKEVVFDYIFMDPPYRKQWENQVLEKLSDSSICAEKTTVILETAKDISLDEILKKQPWEVMKEKVYKTNKHIFLRKII